MAWAIFLLMAKSITLPIFRFMAILTALTMGNIFSLLNPSPSIRLKSFKSLFYSNQKSFQFSFLSILFIAQEIFYQITLYSFFDFLFQYPSKLEGFLLINHVSFYYLLGAKNIIFRDLIFFSIYLSIGKIFFTYSTNQISNNVNRSYT